MSQYTNSDDLLKILREGKKEIMSFGDKSLFIRYNGGFEIYKKGKDENGKDETKCVYRTPYVHKAASFYNNLSS